MASSSYPIDPDLPQRDAYSSTNNQDEMNEQNFASLVHAVNFTQRDATKSLAEARKRKRADTSSEGDSNTELSIPKRTKPYGLKYPYPDREASPFLSPTTKSVGPDPSNALFRKANRAPAKKYTRPPTKDVFHSLKIGTEEWVRLEAEAKGFMLDEMHPERQASVGNRGAAPTNDTKIQLFKTVQKFLAEGAGQCYFGEGAGTSGAGEDRWIYSRDEDRLIGLLTPLMRRMVTNERQRQYARRTRQGGASVQGAEPEVFISSAFVESTREHTTIRPAPTSSTTHEITPTSGTPYPSNATHLIYLTPTSQILHRETLPTPSQTSYTNLLATINAHLLSTTASRLNLPGLEAVAAPPSPQPETDLSVDVQVRTAKEVYQAAYEAHKAALQKAALDAAAQVCPTFEIEVHSVKGLVKIDSERLWGEVVCDVEANAWMTGWLRVLVRVSDG